MRCITHKHQVQRLKRRYRPDSIAWVQHGNRGRPMPWALSLPQKQLILTLARGKYLGFNDSHLAEKLRAEEDLAVSRETVCRILRAALRKMCFTQRSRYSILRNGAKLPSFAGLGGRGVRRYVVSASLCCKSRNALVKKKKGDRDFRSPQGFRTKLLHD
jgi:transposase